MRFAADYSETGSFFVTSVDLGVGSVGSTENVQTIFEKDGSASTFTIHNTTGFFSCGVMSRAVCSDH